MARRCPGVDLLKVEMLAYELRIRHQSSEGTRAELAARLRAASHLPVDVAVLEPGEVVTTIEILEPFLADSSKSLSSLDQLTPKQLDRVRAQLNHFVNRLEDLKGLAVDSGALGKLGELSKVATRLLLDASSLSLDSNVGEGELVVQSFGKEKESDPGPSTLSVIAPRDELPLARSAQFANLPNPILCAFKGLEKFTIVTKEGVRELLWFLVELEQLGDTFCIAHSIFWTLLYPLTDGSLRDLVSRALKEGRSLKEFRERVVREELPFQWNRELEGAYLWRTQRCDEPLSQYIDEVRTAFLALTPDVSQEQAVTRIVEALCPQYRTQLLVLGRPVSWEQLLKSIKEIMRYALVDEQRVRGGTGGEYQSPRRGEYSEPPKVREPKRCFRCRATDHLVRQCPVPREPREHK